MAAAALSVAGRPDRRCGSCAGISPEGDTVVLSDGAGSAVRGSLGSHIAVMLALDEIRRAAQAGASAPELSALLQGRYQAHTGGQPDIVATCLFVILCEEQLAVGRAGRGLAGVLLDDGRWEVLPSSLGASDAVLPAAVVSCRSWPRANVRAVFLATDGVSGDLAPGSQPALVSALVDLAQRDGIDALRRHLFGWLTRWRPPGALGDRSVGILIPWMP